MTDQPTITDQTYAAYRTGRHEHRLFATHFDGPNTFGGECCDRAGLAAAAPHIAAQALRELHREVATRPGYAEIADLIDARADEYRELAARPGSAAPTESDNDGPHGDCPGTTRS